MLVCQVPVFALLAFVWPALGANIFRHASDSSHAAGSIVKAVQTGAKNADNAEEVHRVAGLLDVERDLETDKKKDDTNLRELEAQIVGLVHKRDAAKRDEARKDREIAFLQNQIGRRTGASTEATAEVAQETQQEIKAQAAENLNVESAIASADQVVHQAEASDSVVQRSEEKVDSSAQVEAQRKAQAEAQVEAEAQRRAQVEAEAVEAQRREQAAKAAAATAAAEEQKRKAEAEESRAAFEARIRAEAEDKARLKIQAEQEAENRLRAEAEAKARVKLEAEAKAKAKLEAEASATKQQAEEAESARAEEERKKKDALADSADDSFKQFMKEEDGEDQMGDSDYEDSANALAGAIGWDRKEIETKADSAVKQLTEAIGGKKVVKSLQGMMAGVR